MSEITTIPAPVAPGDFTKDAPPKLDGSTQDLTLGGMRAAAIAIDKATHRFNDDHRHVKSIAWYLVGSVEDAEANLADAYAEPAGPHREHRIAKSLARLETAKQQAETIPADVLLDLDVMLAHGFLPDDFKIEQSRVELEEAISKFLTLLMTPRTFLMSPAAGSVLAIVKCLASPLYEEIESIAERMDIALDHGLIGRGEVKFDRDVECARNGDVKKDYSRAPNGRPYASNSSNVRWFVGLKQVILRWDSFTQSMEYLETEGRKVWRRLDGDIIDRWVSEARSDEHEFDVDPVAFRRELEVAAKEHETDVLRDAVATLKWDGVRRLDDWLSRVTGNPDDAWHKLVGRNIIGGIVKRAFDPGAKHDETALLIGPEETRKSTFVEVLSLHREWWRGKLNLSDPMRDILATMKGKIIVELAELDGMSKVETNKVKSFLTVTDDAIRKLYSDDMKEQPRRCIFIGTTNEDAPLVSQTGNRRWLPVRIERTIDIEMLREMVPQLYAEAAHDYAKGDNFLVPREMKDTARAIQEEARSKSAIEDALSGVNLPADCFISPAVMEAWSVARGYRQIGPVRSAFKLAGFKTVSRHNKVTNKQERVWLRGHSENAVPVRVQEFTNGSADLTCGQPAKAYVPPILPPILQQ